MTAPKLSRKTLEDLQRRHVAFLENRLTSAEARADWIRAFDDGYDELLAVRIRDVLEPAALATHLQEALSVESVRTLIAPAARALQLEILHSLRGDRTSVGDYVPEQARRAIHAVLARPGLVPDVLVRKIFEQPVIIDAIHDTLHEGLTQFNTTVNPFFAEWGLPAVLRRMPIGGGMILASMDAMRAEFDRRLEPEIRKFLAPFSRRAAAELGELFLAKSGDARFMELRGNLVTFLYSRSPAELLAGVDDEVALDGGLAAEAVVVDFLGRGDFVERLQQVLETFVADRGEGTIGDWLGAAGATGRPNLEGWAELLWPVAEGTMRSATVRSYLRAITREFYEGLAG